MQASTFAAEELPIKSDYERSKSKDLMVQWQSTASMALQNRKSI
jgi:hypothetical protein